MTLVRLAPAASRSRVKHSTTEPLRSLHAISESAILQRNRSKMTVSLSFYHHSFVKFHGIKIWEPQNDSDNEVCYKGTVL